MAYWPPDLPAESSLLSHSWGEIDVWEKAFVPEGPVVAIADSIHELATMRLEKHVDTVLHHPVAAEPVWNHRECNLGRSHSAMVAGM